MPISNSVPPVVSVSELLALQASGRPVVVVDCRFNLADIQAGRSEYLAGHLPEAVYTDLEGDLSGAVVRGKTGRHPLPEADAFARVATKLGIDSSTHVVAYDDGSCMFAPRLWWLLHFFRHSKVSVLRGGVKAWLAANHALETSVPTPSAARFNALPDPTMVATLQEVEAHVASAQRTTCLLDARAEPRFRGEQEPIDPVAGHIPTARNLPFAHLLEAGGPKADADVRGSIEAVIGAHVTHDIIAYCGSGVTACALIWAAACAGISGIRLYPGSWSEWITSEHRPVARGDV